MTEAPKLLPCPFCGGTPHLDLQEKRKAGDYFTLRCCHIDDFCAWSTLDEIAAAWNRRPEAAVSAARKEGMLEAAEFCHWNAVGLNPRHGYIVDPWTEEQGGSHPGHAYAKALRAKAETTP